MKESEVTMTARLTHESLPFLPAATRSPVASMGTIGRLRRAFSLKSNFRELFVLSPGHYRAVDGLRGLGILWVVLAHLMFLAGIFIPRAQFLKLRASSFLVPVWHGTMAGDIFLVISGFVIGDMVLREREETGTVAFGNFYLRRALRLLPPYFLAIALNAHDPNVRNAWANVLYINNFLPANHQFMSWSWSLAIEEQFYTIFPLFVLGLYLLPRRARGAAIGVVMVLAVVIAWVVAYRHRVGIGEAAPWIDPGAYVRYFDVYDKPYVRFGALVIGVWVAHARMNTAWLSRFHKSRSFPVLLRISLILMVACISVPEGRPDWANTDWPGITYYAWGRYVFSACTGFLLLALDAEHPLAMRIQRALSLRFLHPVAKFSYSIYLLHPTCIVIVYLVMGLGTPRAPAHSLIVVPAVAVLVTFFVSLLSYLFVEAPSMKLRPPRPKRPLRAVA
jgi:peptidoglycan/LPS O-acetylase OafA/YrhL